MLLTELRKSALGIKVICSTTPEYASVVFKYTGVMQRFFTLLIRERTALKVKGAIAIDAMAPLKMAYVFHRNKISLIDPPCLFCSLHKGIFFTYTSQNGIKKPPQSRR